MPVCQEDPTRDTSFLKGYSCILHNTKFALIEKFNDQIYAAKRLLLYFFLMIKTQKPYLFVESLSTVEKIFNYT